MLQISQTENPMCSATIDQIRLRRAISLPLLSQKVRSSGFQSDIHVGSFALIAIPCVEKQCGGPRVRAPFAQAEGLLQRSAHNSDDSSRRTASMASQGAIQALCQHTAARKTS